MAIEITQQRPESPNRRGSIIDPHYTMRSQTMYTLPETELRNISHLNTLAIIFFSIGSFFISTCVSVLVDGIISAKDDLLTLNSMSEIVILICVVIALIMYALGAWQLIERKTILSIIRDESKEIK